MTHGIPERDLAKIREVLSGHPAVEQAVLYGSRAKGTHSPGSDIDLTLTGEGLTLRELGRIADALDDLLLPYTLDLSLHSKIDHADLLDHIRRVGIVLYPH